MPDQLAIRYTDRRDLSVTVGPETIAVGRPPSAVEDWSKVLRRQDAGLLALLASRSESFVIPLNVSRQCRRSGACTVPEARNVRDSRKCFRTVRLVARGLSPLPLHDLPKLGTTMLGPVASGRMRLVVGREVLKPIVDLR
jgi:hypothetical protein